MGALDLGLGQSAPARSRERLAERQEAVQDMRRSRTLRRTGLGRQDGKGIVGLHGVGIDHDPVAPFRECERQRRLAAGGRAGDDDDLILCLCSHETGAQIANPRPRR